MTWSFPRFVAHRGGALLAPENTLPAFEEAARRGYHCVECDVALTSDAVPVLMHDSTLRRTAGLDARLSETSAGQVATLDAGAWFHPRFAGTRVPTLEAAIACWQRLGLQALIELKTGPGQDAERLGRGVATIVLRCWHGPPPMFIAFDAAALIAAAAVAPHVPRALLFDTPWPDDWFEQMRAAQAIAIDIEQTTATRERVDAVHAAGAGLAVWTVNDPDRARDLLAIGVDAITTDAIDRIAP